MIENVSEIDVLEESHLMESAVETRELEDSPGPDPACDVVLHNIYIYIYMYLLSIYLECEDVDEDEAVLRDEQHPLARQPPAPQRHRHAQLRTHVVLATQR